MLRRDWRAAFGLGILILCLFGGSRAFALSETVHSFRVQMPQPGTLIESGPHGERQSAFTFESLLEVVFPGDADTNGTAEAPWVELVSPRLVVDGQEVPLDLSSVRFAVTFHDNGALASADIVPELAPYGIYLQDLLAPMYPPPRPPQASVWSVEQTHALLTPDGLWEGTLMRELTAPAAVGDLQMSARLERRPAIDWKATATLKLDPASVLVTQATQAIEALLQARDTSEQVTFTLVWVIDRLAEHERVREPQTFEDAPITYTDPAQRFRLQLPPAWTHGEMTWYETATQFEGPNSSRLIVDVFSANTLTDVDSLIVQRLTQYEARYGEVQSITSTAPATLGGGSATLVELEYASEGRTWKEGSLFAKYADHFYVLTVVAPAVEYERSGWITLLNIGERLQLLDPNGRVDPHTLRTGDWVRYESFEWGLSIEVPEFWVLREREGSMLLFSELGGAGHLEVRMEPFMGPEAELDLVALLTRWFEQLQQADATASLLKAPSPAHLGRHLAAEIGVGTVDGGGTPWIRHFVLSYWDGHLIALSIDYHQDGFSEREDIFARILGSVSRRDTEELLSIDTLPPPIDGASRIVIGRLLKADFAADSFSPEPVADAHITLQIGDTTMMTVQTDSEGYFYRANLPPEEPIYLTGLRGSLFGEDELVQIELDRLKAMVRGRVGLLGELLLVLMPDGTLQVLQLPAVEPGSGHSPLHDHMRKRFPYSPWASILQQNVAAWL